MKFGQVVGAGLLVAVLGVGGYGQQDKKDEPKQEEKGKQEQENKQPSEQQKQELEKRIAELIQKLGDDEWKVRVEAQEELTKIGKPALKALKKAAKDSDLERAERATQILEAINKTPFEVLFTGVLCLEGPEWREKIIKTQKEWKAYVQDDSLWPISKKDQFDSFRSNEKSMPDFSKEMALVLVSETASDDGRHPRDAFQRVIQNIDEREDKLVVYEKQGKKVHTGYAPCTALWITIVKLKKEDKKIEFQREQK